MLGQVPPLCRDLCQWLTVLLELTLKKNRNTQHSAAAPSHRSTQIWHLEPGRKAETLQKWVLGQLSISPGTDFCKGINQIRFRYFSYQKRKSLGPDPFEKDFYTASDSLYFTTLSTIVWNSEPEER